MTIPLDKNSQAYRDACERAEYEFYRGYCQTAVLRGRWVQPFSFEEWQQNGRPKGPNK